MGQKANRRATLPEIRLMKGLTRPRLRMPELNQGADTSIQIEMICGNGIQVSGSPIRGQTLPLPFMKSPIHQTPFATARSI